MNRLGFLLLMILWIFIIYILNYFGIFALVLKIVGYFCLIMISFFILKEIISQK